MKFLKEYSKTIRFRTLGLAILGGIIFFGGALTWKVINKEAPPESYLFLLMAISMFCIAVSSAFVVKYKEMPRSGQLPSITGGWAVFCGLLALIASGVAFCFFAYKVITGYLGK